eukprot:RCo017932
MSVLVLPFGWSFASMAWMEIMKFQSDTGGGGWVCMQCVLLVLFEAGWQPMCAFVAPLLSLLTLVCLLYLDLRAFRVCGSVSVCTGVGLSRKRFVERLPCK